MQCAINKDFNGQEPNSDALQKIDCIIPNGMLIVPRKNTLPVHIVGELSHAMLYEWHDLLKEKKPR